MDETPEQRVERVLDKLRQNPRVTIIEDYDEVEDDAIVEADITLLPKMSESQKEYWRSKRKRDEGSA